MRERPVLVNGASVGRCPIDRNCSIETWLPFQKQLRRLLGILDGAEVFVAGASQATPVTLACLDIRMKTPEGSRRYNNYIGPAMSLCGKSRFVLRHIARLVSSEGLKMVAQTAYINGSTTAMGTSRG